MDFIERLFGISPDGGDGTAELMIFVAVVVVLAAIAWRRLQRARRPGQG